MASILDVKQMHDREQAAIKHLDPALREPAPVDAVAAVLDARQHTHGDYTDHAAVTQDLKRVMASTSRWDLLHDHERETLEMIAHKIGRILSGNPHFNDHWLDIAGYAKLSADRNPVK
jgi:DNA-binding PucR family transcriptional regulator